MKAIETILLAAAAIVLFSGCEHTPTRIGQSTTVQFGVVQSAEQVTLDSNALQGALLGGMLGVVGGRGDSAIGNAAVGAKVGTVAAAAGEGNRSGMAYTVAMPDGSTTRIVTDQREIKPGDCVAIERTRNAANIRRAASSYCDPANARAVEEVTPTIRTAAIECQRAKEELAGATTEAEVDLAARKISLLCDA